MKTLIIGGGKGCRSILELTTGAFLKELRLDIQAVVDINRDAPGMLYAGEMGLKTLTSLEEALSLPGIELVIELTGSDSVLQELYKLIPPGVKIIDHTITHIFWDLSNAQEEQKRQLNELEKLDKKLQNESRFLQTLFDSNADLAVVLDKNQNIVRANAKFYEFTAQSPENVIGKKCYDVLHDSMLDCKKENLECPFLKVLQTGLPETSIRRTPPPNESHWEIMRTPIFDLNGEIEAILGTWHKITERVMLRREIETAQQRFISFINSAQDWISIKDLEGRYIIVNPVTARAFNYKPEDFVGRKPEEILPQKLSRTINRHDKEVIQYKQHRTFNETIPVNGQDHHFQTLRFPLTDYQGDIIGVCTIARDVTNEVRLKEQLMQSEKLAALGKLAAGVAHEINNPLTGILAYAEDLLDEITEKENLRQDLKVIIRETLRCRDIVRNLLDFARQDIPKFEIKEPNKIVEKSLSLVERLPQFKDITIIKSLSGDIPVIKSDPKQIEQVILNFLLNAADAMQFKGSIRLGTEYDRKEDKCIIYVEDTGTGIPENLIDKIFEPFFSTKGTNGLGLAVSWGIIERHNGTIEVDTAESGGAIFRIILPVYKN